MAHLSANLPRSFNVNILYHNYQVVTSVVNLANYFVEISAASNYTCGIRFLGTLFCWGENSPNQLLGASDATLTSSGVGFPCKGDTNQTCVTKPIQIAIGHYFTHVATGGIGACAIEKGTGLVWCWGNNSNGLLGVSISAGELVPPTPIASSIQFQQIAAGGTHFCGVSSGTAYCWGDNTFGEIGNGVALESFGQVGGVTSPYALGTGWTQISAGNSYSCGIQNSVAKCWGGYGDIYVIGAGVGNHLTPSAVTASWGSAAPTSLSVAGGDAQTMCAVIPAGSPGAGAWCWGHDVGDPNGYNPVLGEAYIPMQLPNGNVLTQVANGWHQGCGLDGVGNALCWGSNLYGATGVRNSMYTSTVTAVNAGGIQFTGITSGDDHVCALTNGGGVYCWGSNEFGQFGDNDQQLVGIPTPTVVWGTNP
jgi:alpha-tubulin suppressor-like RCC1 family protein